MGDMRPAHGTPVNLVRTGAVTLAETAADGDYAEHEKPDCAPPTPRAMKGTRGEGSLNAESR